MQNMPIFFLSEISSPLKKEESSLIKNNQTIYTITPFKEFKRDYHANNQKLLDQIKKYKKGISNALSFQKEFNCYVRKYLDYQYSINQSLQARLKDNEILHQELQEKISVQEADSSELQEILNKQEGFIKELKIQINNQRNNNLEIKLRLQNLESLDQKLTEMFNEHEQSTIRQHAVYQRTIEQQLDEQKHKAMRLYDVLTQELQNQSQFLLNIETEVDKQFKKQKETILNKYNFLFEYLKHLSLNQKEYEKQIDSMKDLQEENNNQLLNQLENEHQFNDEAHFQMQIRANHLEETLKQIKTKLESEDAFGNLLALGDRIQVFYGGTSSSGIFIKINLPFLYWIEDNSNKLWITNTNQITISKG